MEPISTTDPAGCLLILMPRSARMMEDVRIWLAHRLTAEGEAELRDLPRELTARYLADELLDGLVNTVAAGYPIPLDVAVLGYNAGEDGKLKLVSLLPDGNPEARFVPLANLAANPAEPRALEGEPRKWTHAPTCEGTAPAATALAEVYRLISMWLTGRYSTRPPVVIHCTDGAGIDEHYNRIARSLGILSTVYGPVRLLHVGLAAGIEPFLCGFWPDSIPEPWAELMAVSAELPAEPEGRPARRAVSVNDWCLTDAWSAIFDVAPSVDTDSWPTPQSPPIAAHVRELWTQKMGNAPGEWEDAFACDPASGVVVVADGASSGIYCRIWADQLARRYIADRPDAREAIAFGKWVHGLRGEWRAAINYPTLNWAKQRKVDEVGAAATFLALEIGPANAEGFHPWRACAVGDASLFWVREGRLLASFPVVAADQFGSSPLLIRSNPGFKTLSLLASALCQPGDRFLLATDAVAARLLKSTASGPGPDWNQFETIAEEDWKRELDSLRQSRDMVNDDCTLVAIQVAAAETPDATLPATIEENEAVPPTSENQSPAHTDALPESMGGAS